MAKVSLKCLLPEERQAYCLFRSHSAVVGRGRMQYLGPCFARAQACSLCEREVSCHYLYTKPHYCIGGGEDAQVWISVAHQKLDLLVVLALLSHLRPLLSLSSRNRSSNEDRWSFLAAQAD